jgi:DNA-binding response OmpR family regulator
VRHDGHSGYKAIADNEYDLLLVDILLPGQDGLALCRAARSDGVTTPILLLTARDSVADRVAGLDAGADDYLVKPFALEELQARVRALLRRERKVLLAEVTLGALAIDFTNRAAAIDGRPLSLSSREFGLLEYLVHNRELLRSRDAIVEHVWGNEYVGHSNVVDVYIGYLRRKLGEGPGVPRIETVRGSGYRLTA